MKELIRVRVQYASRQQCCKTHKRPLPFFYLLTYLLTPCGTVFIEKLIGSQFHSRNSPHIMEPEGSLPHSQVAASCPYPESARSSPYPHIPVLKILPSMPGLPKWSPSLMFPHKKSLHASHLHHTRYMPRLSHLDFYHPNDIGKLVQTSGSTQYSKVR